MNTRNSSSHTKKYRQVLSSVHMVYRLVNSTYNTQELILRLTRLLCQFIQASSSAVYLFDTDAKKVVLKASFDNKINILVKKKKELANFSPPVDKVLKGFTVFEKHIIGLPLVADEIIGAIFVYRKRSETAFNEYDKDLLSVVGEQSVTAIKNLQLNEEQQKTILGSIKFISKLLKAYGHNSHMNLHTPHLFKIIKAIALKLHVGQEGIESLYYVTILRDAGLIDVPYNILAKTSQLSSEEFKVIREHPTKSVELIRPVEFLKPVLPIILYHHEHYDGSGYPSGLRKEQIPLGARILGVVAAFEAMTSERPYKRCLSVEEAIEELKAHSGSQFDPMVVGAFVELVKQKNFRKYLRSTN